MQSMNMMVYIAFKAIPVSANFAAAVSPATVLLLLVLFLPVAALVASVLLLTSGYAKSYKEAQLYFMPVMLLGIAPALAPMLPELPLRSIVVLVPIANIALAVKEILVGSFDWPMIALAWLVTTGTAVWITRKSVSFLSAERLITATTSSDVSPRDGAALFSRHVGRWFGILWAVVWIVNSYTAKADVRVQIVVNLVLLFFGATLLMLWRYRLNPPEALALRAPKPMVWLGVLCAIPGGILTASGLGRLMSYFLPVSTETMEQFTRLLLPEGITTAELIFFLAIMPAVFEEMTFRGLLLHGLRKRLHPVALVIVVGLTFGIFHFALFRFAGTALLGMLLATTTLLTGSIFPSMLWHFGNNALSLLTELAGVPESEFDWKYYSAGVVLLAVAFWIFWRERKPYPGLRSWK
jgi:sodium transport system permease protein